MVVEKTICMCFSLTIIQGGGAAFPVFFFFFLLFWTSEGLQIWASRDCQLVMHIVNKALVQYVFQ